MSRAAAFLGWLEDTSDWLSPIVVKEVRQVVRGREFNYSFGASLVAGLAVAFVGATDALGGSGTAGRWTFYALSFCLGFLGLAVVPLSAFGALRAERMEQTLDLITLTALSPRRIVIGKLMAQAVKLGTLFAAMAPFIAMSFLLGGIDFVTILLSLLLLFMWSLWASAACLFLSSLFRSRAMSGLLLGAVGIVLFVVFGLGRAVFFVASRGGVSGGAVTLVPGGAPPWWLVAMVASGWLAMLVNLVLLAENRLSLPTENRATALRVGFLLQFLLVVGWTLSFIGEAPIVRGNAAEALGALGGLHLALVAMFVVTEDLVVPRRARLAMKRRWWLAMFYPGGGRGALYVLAQMAILVAATRLLDPSPIQLRWMLALCGYICVFSGLPVSLLRVVQPARAASVPLRVTVLMLLPMSMILPDLIDYVLRQPATVDLTFARRHLVNPFRTLATWHVVEDRRWFVLPFALGITGVAAYLALVEMGRRTARLQAAPDDDLAPGRRGETADAPGLLGAAAPGRPAGPASTGPDATGS